MHENMTILAIVLIILGYGYFSKILSQINISGPMVFTTVGILISPLVFGFGAVNIKGEPVQIIAEVTLILVLFGDASALNLKRLKYLYMQL